MPESDLFRGLAEVLRSGDAQPIVMPERVAPSTIYDMGYRICIIACAFDTHAKMDLSGTRRIQAIRLKLLQFVAMRPWLISVLREWAVTEADPQLSVLTSQNRRGFLGDAVHDHVVDYLVARQIFTQSSSHLSLGTNGGTLERIPAALAAEGLFGNERAALAQMKEIRITNKMLEGW